jgi:hypothetical protein
MLDGWDCTSIKAGMSIIVQGFVPDGQHIIKYIKGGHYVDLIGINLTTQQVRIADPTEE